MRRQHFKFFFATAALLLLLSVAASAQVAPVRGHVYVQSDDGKLTPVPNAVIDIFRTDMSGKYETKTNKKGEWVHSGLPFVGTYIIAASAPNFQPSYIPNVRPRGDADVDLHLSPGDGRRLTLAEIRATEATSGGNAAPGTSAPKESAEDRKKREELMRQNAEIEAKNAKNMNINEVVGRTFKAGNAALTAKNYDEAIKQYDEGIAADPEQTALLTMKAVALKARGVERYNAAVQAADEAAKTAGREAAKKDWAEAVASGKLAVASIKDKPAPAEAAAQASQNANKLGALAALAEAMRLYVSKGDPSQADAGHAAFQEYIAAETDPVKKAKAEMDDAQMLFDAGAPDKALAAYQKILEANPDNPDALLYAGLSLYSLGATNNDKAKYQEAANYLQRFVDKAPETHKMKADAKAVLEEVKNQQNIKPERTAPATTTRRRRP